MGYGGGLLADLAAPLDRGVDRFARRAANEVGKDLLRRVTMHTPVAKRTPEVVASYGTGTAWVTARKRQPGALRDSWEVGEVTLLHAGRYYRVPVFTRDPVAPHVEWPTMPHLIAPRRPGGLLTIPTRHGMVFAKLVHHPGTQGSYMMATALQEIAATWRAEAARLWAAEVRAIFSS